VARFEPAAANKAIELRPQPSRLRVCSDPELTERAVSNLIDNAIRHAQCTKIVIGALRRGKTVRLYVIDNGVGIFRRDRATLFDDYAQGSDHGDVIRGGFGLGLASARRAMELMGGKVEFDERWTSGSAFFLEFR
jgi:signal transduction histidine kinase